MASTTTTSSITIVNNSSVANPILPVEFQAHTDDKMVTAVSEILNIPVSRDWSIIDRVDHLALVNYSENADMAVFGHLRGILVDTEARTVLTTSFGYTPTAVCEKLLEIDGHIHIKDKDGVAHHYALDKCTIKRAFEGVVFRVFLHKGKMYTVTHRKINPSRSRWGSSKNFLDMWTEANAPSAADLFNLTSENSSNGYNFIVVHPELLVASRQRVTAPYLVFLGSYNIETKRENTAPGIYSPLTSEVDNDVKASVVHEPKALTVADANAFLECGYYDRHSYIDDRLNTGESVIMYVQDEKGFTNVLKVNSPSFDWRVSMRGDNPNIRHQFYSLLNITYPNVDTDEAWERFSERLIVLPLHNPEMVKSAHNIMGYTSSVPEYKPEEEYDMYETRDKRVQLLWMNYLIALPYHQQAQVLPLLDEVKNERNAVISWIQELERSGHRESEHIIPRIKNLITISRQLAQKKISSGQNVNRNGKKMSKPVVIADTLRNLISKEDGASLYALVRSMRRYKEESAKQV